MYTLYVLVLEHGLAIKAVGIRVQDAAIAYKESVANGAVGASEPRTVVDKATGLEQTVSEIKYFGDTVIRWISGPFTGPALANYESVVSPDTSFG